MSWYYWFSLSVLDDRRPADRFNVGGYYSFLFATRKVDSLLEAKRQFSILNAKFPSSSAFKLTCCRRPNLIESLEETANGRGF